MDKKQYMQLAIQLAKATKGQTSPNPAVGAVIVNNGEIVGIGTHLKAGEAHAEVHAIKMAGSKAEGATIYVTLEPCSHYGKTPPCASLIIEKKIKKVVIATQDPNPIVSGKGIEMLTEAGVDVEIGLCQAEAEELNQDIFHFNRSQTPFVTLKTAMTLDGKIATLTGESKWITGKKAREDVHHYRHTHDAILVGVGTVLKDNPKLTTRLPEGGKNPIRIILDRELQTPVNSYVIQDESTPTWLVIDKSVENKQKARYNFQHVTFIEVSQPHHYPDLMQKLGELGITSLFVEGGSRVNNRFLKSKLVDQYIFYIAPTVIGGSNAPTSFEGTGFQHLKDALKLQFESVEQIGEDLKIVAKPKVD